MVSDNYAEYYDDAFLNRLGVKELKQPLLEFWPASGPRWDGLARAIPGAWQNQCGATCRTVGATRCPVGLKLDSLVQQFALWHPAGPAAPPYRVQFLRFW